MTASPEIDALIAAIQDCRNVLALDHSQQAAVERDAGAEELPLLKPVQIDGMNFFAVPVSSDDPHFVRAKARDLMQAVLDERGAFESNGIDDYLLLIFPDVKPDNGEPSKDTKARFQICNEIERDARVCRKLTFSPLAGTDDIDALIERSPLSMPWKRSEDGTEGTEATLNAYFGFSDELTTRWVKALEPLIRDAADDEALIDELIRLYRNDEAGHTADSRFDGGAT